ncbi:Pectinesterase inhibitor domain [Macleaya cordata]|uniref:Pectinesterase inhibitor domain n=1 Tax=Macleaya cordata TaxID=56857 RepID=A0A200PR65_MACCD|nr:Pectinesterase inhibitor domain [Macleaya cordata]
MASINIQQTPLLLLAVIFISFFHFQSYAAAAAAPAGSGLEDDQGMAFLEETCRHTQFHDLCLSFLLSDSRTTATSDRRGLLRIALDMAMTNASHVLSYIRELLGNYKSSSNSNSNTTTFNVTSIETCGQEYNDSLTNLQWAVEALFDGIDGEDYHDANNFIEAAITIIDHCKRKIIDELVREELSKSLTDMNENMSNLLHISQDILCYLSPDSCSRT